jgi:hypothetical protein
MSSKKQTLKEKAFDIVMDSINDAVMNEDIPIQKVREACDDFLNQLEREARNMLKGIKRRRP